MSEGIRGNGPPRPQPSSPQARLERASTGEVGEAHAELVHEASSGEAHPPLDVFEGGAPKAQVKQELQSIASQRALSGVQFSDQELQKLAGQLIVVFRRNPKATTRAARAKLATRAILRGSGSGRLAKLLGKLDEQEAEEMEGDIASMIAESPRLGEWLDSISEEAGRT